MIIRQLKQDQFLRLNESLMMKAQINPQDVSYAVNMQVNEVECIVKIQPERHCKIVILQALRIYRENHGPSFQLLTQANLLSSLLEILIYQEVGQQKDTNPISSYPIYNSLK